MSESGTEKAKADEQAQKRDEAHDEMAELERREELPRDLKDWPSGKGKFVTFAEGDDSPYGEGATAKLGPPVTHHEDGSVSVDGKKVDNPEDYKGEPIPLPLESYTEANGGEENRADEKDSE